MNSLIITDKERYPDSSPCCSPCDVKTGKKEKVRKYAPTIELTGPQVEAFGLNGTANLDQTGCAKIYFKVKSVSAGESYGEDIDTKKTPTKVRIQLTDVEVLDEAVDGASSDADDVVEKDKDDEKPVRNAKEKVSPKDAELPE